MVTCTHKYIIIYMTIRSQGILKESPENVRISIH